jgi:hypothetical protein
VDLDYEINEGDDDLYVDNVDEDEEKAKKTSVKGKEDSENYGDS